MSEAPKMLYIDELIEGEPVEWANYHYTEAWGIYRRADIPWLEEGLVERLEAIVELYRIVDQHGVNAEMNRDFAPVAVDVARDILNAVKEGE